MNPEELKKKIAYTKELKQFRNKAAIKKCLHPENQNCSNRIIKAHSIQNNKYLNKLSRDVNGQSVVYITHKFTIDEKNKISGLKSIGRNSASTFTGFCSFHDTELFSVIENFDLEFTREQVFLHSYRAFNSSYHHFNEFYQGHVNDENQKKRFKSEFDYYDWSIKTMLELNEIKKLKEKLDRFLIRKKYDGLHSMVVFLHKQEISLASCGAIQLRYMPNNQLINKDGSLANLMVTTLPEKNFSVVILSCFTGDLNGRKFIDGLVKYTKPVLHQIISSLLINYTESTILSPHLWKLLGNKKRKIILENILLSRGQILDRNIKLNKFLKLGINLFSKTYAL